MSRLLLPRMLHYGDRGDDVTAIQRALHRAHPSFRDLGATGYYGTRTIRNVLGFQKAALLQADGIVGPVTFAEMARRGMFDKVCLTLLGSPVPPAPRQPADRVVHAAMVGYVNRDLIHYSEDMLLRMAWFANNLRLPLFPRYTDCSAFAAWTFWTSNLADPSGTDWAQHGPLYTGTETQHGVVVPLSAARGGDLAFYYQPISHVSVVVDNSRVVSHGNEDGPMLEGIGVPTEVRRYL